MSSPKVKHTPLSKSEKFWETVPTSSRTAQPSSDSSTDDLLKIIIAKLDKIIEKMEK